jgi:hypothetical protein
LTSEHGREYGCSRITFDNVEYRQEGRPMAVAAPSTRKLLNDPAKVVKESLPALDDEPAAVWDAPVHTPALRWGA